MTSKENKPGKVEAFHATKPDSSRNRTVYIYSNETGKPHTVPALTLMQTPPLHLPEGTLRVGAQVLSHDERLTVSQCATLLNQADAASLSYTSPLSAWMDAWERAGILDSVMTATLGDIELAKKTLSSQHMSLDEIPVRSWPAWGLRGMLEEQRLDLNRHARNGTRYQVRVSNNASIAQCGKHGNEAPLIEWIRAWKSTRTRNTVFASLAGVGHCFMPESISQCEMAGEAGVDIVYRIALFSPFTQRTLSRAYVFSGYLREAGEKYSYAYHPLTRDQIPSIDASNWISGNRLSLTYECDGSHPFRLITNSAGRRLCDLDGWHVMGLHINAEPSRASDQRPVQAFDVLAEVDFALMGSGVVDLKSPSPESRAMPGVFPRTWLVDFAASTENNSRGSAIALCRKADNYELAVNGWLLRIACMSNVPMHRQHSSFRTAKFDTESVKHLMHPANDFALMHTTSGRGGQKGLSNFRMPIGSLISSGITLKGFTDSGHYIDAASAHEALIASLRECLVTPRMDLDYFMHWLIFDALTGFLAQMPYRYQIIYINTGLSLCPIPFWSLAAESVIRENVSSDFGYQIVFDAEDATSYLSGDSLARLADVAGLDPSALLRFRSACLERLKLSADKLIAELVDHAKKHNELEAEQFRTAKSKIEWIKSRA